MGLASPLICLIPQHIASVSTPIDIGDLPAYKPSLPRKGHPGGTEMKARKATKHLRKSKKLEATKPLKSGKADFSNLSITKVLDKTSPTL